MDYKTYSKRLGYIKELIEKEQLSSPSQLAIKFDCTERTVRKMISDLKNLGCNIKYSRRKMKYLMVESKRK
jgi:biotin operon repressor